MGNIISNHESKHREAEPEILRTSRSKNRPYVNYHVLASETQKFKKNFLLQNP
jgi:hypothetical protein